MVLALALVSSLCVAAALFPFTGYVWSLSLLPRRPVMRGAHLGPDEAITLCFCAYNEERVLAAKLSNIRRLKARHPGLRVLAYVDAATDRTAELLLAEPRLVETVVGVERKGKTHGMNRLVALATSDLVVFTDANVMLGEAALDRLASWFRDPQVGCVCGHLVYVDGQTAAAETGSLQWRIEELTKARESATGSVMGADGSLFAVRRSLHCPVPDDLIDDMYLSFDILCRGHRVVHAEDVVAREASASDPSDEYRRKVRIACQAVNVHRALWPRLRRLDAVHLYKYLSHRVMRWLCPFLLALALLAMIAMLAIILGPASAAGLIGASALMLALGVRWGWRPFQMAWAASLSLVGVAVGVWQSIRGRRFRTWQPALSVRGASAEPKRGRRVLYLAHDMHDATVRRRVGELQQSDAAVLLAAFHREKVAVPPPHCAVLALGLTRDYAYHQRALATLRGAWLLWRERACLADADVILARNFEPALLGLLVKRLAGGRPLLVYEALDIHRFFVGDRTLNQVFRACERFLLRRINLLVVSSPAFVTRYFESVQRYRNPWLLLENKLPPNIARMLEPAPVERGSAHRGDQGTVWTVGWFGMLRCRRSLALLTQLAEALPDRVRIVIRGYPIEWLPEEFARLVSCRPNMTYGGPYRHPDDLGELYRSVDLVWALDFYDTGANSDWLLPNRLYEAGVFNVPMIARELTALSTRVVELGLGWAVGEPAADAVRHLICELSPGKYAEIRRHIAGLPRSLFVTTDDPLELMEKACARGPTVEHARSPEIRAA